MILYISTILIAMIVISALNIIFGTAVFNYSALYVIVAVIVSTIFEIAIDGLFATIIEKMPAKYFKNGKNCFEVSKKERNFYEKLKIRKWKDKVIELGMFSGFRKNKIYNPTDPAYFERFIVESNKGIVIHIVCCIVGFFNIFILPFKYALVISVPIAFVNLILNLLPTMILRYNIPKLQIALKRLNRTNDTKTAEQIKENDTKDSKETSK